MVRLKMQTLLKIFHAFCGMALVLALSPSARAQMYSTGPGFYMSLEGRSLQGAGERTSSLPSSSAATKDDTGLANKTRDDKDLGGKASLGYRFENNWDIGVSGSGFKSQR
jgi:hypothetical protein